MLLRPKAGSVAHALSSPVQRRGKTVVYGYFEHDYGVTLLGTREWTPLVDGRRTGTEGTCCSAGKFKECKEIGNELR